MSKAEFCELSGDSYSLNSPKGIEAKVYEQLKPSTVKVLHGLSFGSGIVLDPQEHIATDVHVALQNRHLQIQTPNGPLDAFIEKLNVIDDVAILSVPGLSKSGFKAAKLKVDAGLSLGTTAYSMGFPKALELGVPCISHGQISDVGALMEITRKAFPNAEFLTSLDVMPVIQGHSLGQFVFNHRDSFAGKADKLEAIAVENGVPHRFGNGTSGGPLADEGADVIGMNDGVHKNQQLLATPAAKIAETASSPSRLRFVYASNQLKSIEPLDPSDKVASDEAALANLVLADNEHPAPPQ